MEELLGWDGTEYDSAYISPDEYDWSEHEDLEPKPNSE